MISVIVFHALKNFLKKVVLDQKESFTKIKDSNSVIFLLKHVYLKQYNFLINYSAKDCVV